MRQSCNFHHRGDLTSPDTANAGCVRFTHSPLHGLCVAGAFSFGVDKPRKAHLHVLLLHYSRGRWSHEPVLSGNDPQSQRSLAWLHFCCRLSLLHCCASACIFLLQPGFPPSHKLCIPELIYSQWPQPDEYGSVPPGAARRREAENTNIVLSLSLFHTAGCKMSHICHLGVTSWSGLSASTPSADRPWANMNSVPVRLMRFVSEPRGQARKPWCYQARLEQTGLLLKSRRLYWCSASFSKLHPTLRCRAFSGVRVSVKGGLFARALVLSCKSKVHMCPAARTPNQNQAKEETVIMSRSQ